MPTILLQEIIDLLNSWKEGLGTQLEQALESLSNLEDNTDELETYLSSIDNYLSSINEDTSANQYYDLVTEGLIFLCKPDKKRSKSLRAFSSVSIKLLIRTI